MAEDKWARWLKEERWSDQRSALTAALDSVRDRVLEMAQLQPGERVIDLGAGTGLLGLKAAEIVGPDGTVLFLDISRDSLPAAMAEAHVGCEHFAVANGLFCPVPDDWADAMVMRSVLIYLPDRQATTRELARVLKPGGRLAAYEPINRRTDWGIDTSGFEDVMEAYRRGMDSNPICTLDEVALAADLRQAGFASVEVDLVETRRLANGKSWLHGMKYGAPAGYNAYDMLLAAGVSPQRLNQFLETCVRRVGDGPTTISFPAMYLQAVR